MTSRLHSGVAVTACIAGMLGCRGEESPEATFAADTAMPSDSVAGGTVAQVEEMTTAPRPVSEWEVLDRIRIDSLEVVLDSTSIRALSSALGGQVVWEGPGGHFAPYICYRVRSGSESSYL